MLLSDAISRMRIDLADTGSTQILTDDSYARAIGKAVSDLSRFLPLDKVIEYTIDIEVSNEAWTADTTAGNYTTLAYPAIKPDSEVVKNSSSVTMTRDTDYTIDYINGKITWISGGSITTGMSCTITYTRVSYIIDISDILDELISINMVEYPVGNAPQTFVSSQQRNDLLFITAGEGSQAHLTDFSHIVIYYKAKHTMPTETAEGSYPSFLDDTIILAADAYILLELATKHEHQAVTDIASSRTELGLTTAVHTLISTALGKVTTHMADAKTALDAANTALDAVSFADVSTYLGYAVTALTAAASNSALGGTALSGADIGAATTALAAAKAVSDAILTTSIDKDTTGAEAYLDTGDANITANNTGKDVAENFANFAQVRANIAAARVQVVNGLVGEAQTRVDSMRTLVETGNGYSQVAVAYVNEASQHIASAQAIIASQQAAIEHASGYANEANGRYSIALAFINEATAELYQIDRYLAEATAYQQSVTQELAIAARFRDEAADRRNEAWTIWRDPSQISPMYNMSSYSQPV
jgi:hypothetical protein